MLSGWFPPPPLLLEVATREAMTKTHQTSVRRDCNAAEKTPDVDSPDRVGR